MKWSIAQHFLNKSPTFAKSRCSLVLILLFFVVLIPTLASANAAEPPSIVILVTQPPSDLKVTLDTDQGPIEAVKTAIAWEGYYAFYSRDLKGRAPYTVLATTSGQTIECDIEGPFRTYNNVFTLDLSKKSLISGSYPFRTEILVGLRVMLTLIIEGIIFWLFQFRDRRSWGIFIVLNLMSQGYLNIWLLRGDELMPAYLIFGLIYGEFFVYLFEILGFGLLIQEKKKKTVLYYVLIANTASLVLGGYLIMKLPV